MLNVYETLNSFKDFYREATTEQTLMYHSPYYKNDIGGYKLSTNGVNYYLLHYFEFDPYWRSKTGYDKTLESDAFFVPVRFVERATMEDLPTTLVFVVNGNLKFILPRQLQAFYKKNNLAIDNGFDELIVPVPLIMLNDVEPFNFQSVR
jgi:hypothetical protein